MLWLGCNRDNTNVNLQQFNQPVIDYNAIYVVEEDLKDFSQILLKMSLKNVQVDIIKFGLSSPKQHQQRLNYYIQNFKQDIFLVSDTDTIPCTDSHFERLYMDLPYRNFILTFNTDILGEQDHLLIKDPVYTNQLIKLSIQKSYE